MLLCILGRLKWETFPVFHRCCRIGLGKLWEGRSVPKVPLCHPHTPLLTGLQKHQAYELSYFVSFFYRYQYYGH